MRSASRIVMFIHDPTGRADPVPDVRVLTQLVTQTPIVWPDRQGKGRTLIYEVTQQDIAADPFRLAS